MSRAAISYLAKCKNYRYIHKGPIVILEHWGNYGWCSQGSYKTWQEVYRYIYE